MEIFVVSFVVFGLSVLGLVAAQWLRRAPIPVGCTPINGECCRASVSSDATSAERRCSNLTVGEG